MIVGIFLRNFKTYKSINYIPITDEDQFCGLVGNNGIGKSSVLESLDCFFNKKTWNYHTSTKNKLSQSQPDIVPIFLIKKSTLNANVIELAEILSNFCKDFTEIDAPPTYLPHIKSFIAHRTLLESNLNLEEFYLLPLGIDYNSDISVSIFKSKELAKKLEPFSSSTDEFSENEYNVLTPLLVEIKSTIEYIYIPREIDPELFTKLETSEIQILMGETLNEIISTKVLPQVINDINTGLTSFIDNLSKELVVYAYRTPTDRQQKLRRQDVNNLIIEAFFSRHKLHKKQGKNWLEISLLSSGEKQKAIIDVAHSLLRQHRKSALNLIIGIDEPESSLHMSACFDQFDSIYEISRDCQQVIFSSHWYGFFPTIETGSATIISLKEDQHVFDLINLANYREQVKQTTANSKGKLPYDIRLKGINDFVQSIITSTIGDDPYNWIICEGSSDKIYLSKYFEDLIKLKKLRIVPVGGASEIKRIYNYLSISYDDFKDEIKGTIIFISDTDEQLVNYSVSDSKNLFCKRIVNCSNAQTTKLVNINHNPTAPKTEIEDALNGKLFLKTLLLFKESNIDNLDFIDSIVPLSENSVAFSLDLKTSERKKIEHFFDTGNNKFLFAQEYVKNIDTEFSVPAWILEIRKWLE